MIITNGMVFGEDCEFKKLDIEVEGGHIKNLAGTGALAGGDVFDAKDCYVLPGFVDIHTHGCVGFDMCDGDEAGLEKMLAYYGSQGVTTAVPATMSYDEPKLTAVLTAAQKYFDKEGYGAILRGVNLEGPFINTEKRGAQNPKYIVNPAIDMFDKLCEIAGGYVKLVDIAPELEGSMEFVKHASKKCTVSLAHTAANYDTAAEAFDAGAKHVTHMFNAMPPFGHRQPGVIGAAFDKAAYVEIISDGFHLHPAVVRSVFSWFSEKRVCLVSDSMRGTGLPDGEYDLGGQMVHMEKGLATLVGTNTIAGSATCLADCCRRAVDMGVPLEHAVRAASYNPACAVGLQNRVGSLTTGKCADIVVWDKDLNTKAVFVGGNRIV